MESARCSFHAEKEGKAELGMAFFRCVLGGFMKGVRVARLALEDGERMFDLDTDASLLAFDLIVYRIQTITQVLFSTLRGSTQLKSGYR
jgi:hypothetical protein